MIVVEIDGKIEEFDSQYVDSPFSTGCLWGETETTKSGDGCRNFLATEAVWGVSAYRRNADGSYFGMKALFRFGEWIADEEGNPLLRVWDKII